MKNADMPAMPQSFSMSETDCGTALTHLLDHEAEKAAGLTKREMFSIHAMQGILSNSSIKDLDGRSISKWSVEFADELLSELEK